MSSRRKRIFWRLEGRIFACLSSAMRLTVVNKRSTSVLDGGGVRNLLASLHKPLWTLFWLSCSCLSQYLRHKIVSNGEVKHFFNSFSTLYCPVVLILFLSFNFWKAAASFYGLLQDLALLLEGGSYWTYFPSFHPRRKFYSKYSCLIGKVRYLSLRPAIFKKIEVVASNSLVI